MPTQPPAPENEALQEHLDAVTRLRLAGYTPDKINEYYGQQTQRLRAAGYSEDKIRAYYGGQDPAPMQQDIQQQVQQNQNAGQHDDWVSLFLHGLTTSSTADLLGSTAQPYAGQGGTGGAIANALGETLGDLPVAIPSAFFQGKATTFGLAKVPGLAETPVPEVAGGITGAFQAGAVPTLIKQARDQWIAAGNQGWNGLDFLQAHGVSAQGAVEAGKVGLASSAGYLVGGPVEGALAKAGVSGVARSAAKVTAEAGAFTATTAALHGKMPQPQDFVEATVIMLAAHTGARFSGATIRAVRGRLQQYYVQTGTDPIAAARAAQNDPVLARQLYGKPMPKLPPGSSRTNVTVNGQTQSFVDNIRSGAPHPDQFGVPRIAGNFDQAVQFTLAHEGGKEAIDSNQSKVKWGINAAEHPGVDVDNLTKEDAAEIYKHAYWDAIGADHLPPDMRLAAFDTAVVEGPAQAKQWLAESGGDVQTFLGKRAAFEANLARSNPAKYGRYADAWASRIRDLGGHGPIHDILGSDPTEPLTEQQRALLDNEGKNPEEGSSWTEEREAQFQAAVARGDYDRPGEHVQATLTQLRADAQGTLDRVMGRRVVITSAERSAASQEAQIAAGRTTTSPGRTEHSAANFAAGFGAWDLKVPGMTNQEVIAVLRDSGLPYDQLIEEGDHVHIGFGPKQRGEVFTMRGGKRVGPVDGPIGGGSKGPPLPPDRPPPDSGEPGDDDYQSRIFAHTVEGDDGTDWLGGGFRAASRLYQELFQGDHPINRFTNSVTTGEPLDDADNPMILRRLAERSQDDARYTINGDGHGNEGAMTDMDGNKIGRSLKAIVDDAGDKDAQRTFLRGYAVSRWAQMMHGEGKDTGLHPEDVDRMVADHPEMEGLFQELVGWRNGTLGWLKGGPLSTKLHDQLVSDKEASIPGYRDMGDGKWRPPMSTRGGKMYNPVGAAKGSTKKLLPIEQSLMREAILRRMLAATNRTNMAIADLGIKTSTAGQKRAVDFNVVKTLSELSHVDAETPIDGIEDMMSQLAKAAGKAVPDDQMPVMRDGKLYAVKFDDDYKDIVPVVRGFDQNTQGLAFKIIAKITSVPRTLQTIANPLFAPHILGLDTLFQSVSNPDARNVITSLVTGLGAGARNPAAYDDWLRHGAEHVFDKMSRSDYLKSVFNLEQKEDPLAGVWNGLQSPWHLLQGWARLNFGALRAGRYIQGLKAGESPMRAGVASTESAYHRVGFGGPVSRTINAVMPYFTARLSGMNRIARNLLGQWAPGAVNKTLGTKLTNKTILGTDYSFKRFMINGAVILTVPAMLSWLAYKDQEWYKAAPDWQKNNAWTWIPPINGGPPIPIGAPPGLSAIFIALPRMLGEAFVQDNPHAFDNWVPSAGASLLGPVSLPSASFLEPVIEHITNHSFFRDQPEVSEDTMKQVGIPEQFNHYSSAEAKGTSRAVGGAMGLSPVIIDNYIRSWGGFPGQLSQFISNMAAGAFEQNKRPDTPIWQMPPFSSYIERYPSASAQPIIDAYNHIDALNQVHGSIVAAMKEGDLSRVQELAKQNPNAAIYHALRLQSENNGINPTPYINALEAASSTADWNDINLIREGERALKQGNAFANGVWNDPNKTPQDKRQILNSTYRIMQGISERLNEAMDRAGISAKHASSHAPPAPGSIEFIPPQEGQ